MSKHSADFKAKVALDAVSHGSAMVKEIADKYGVTEQEVIAWSSQFDKGKAPVFEAVDEAAHHDAPEGEDVEILSSDADLTFAVSYGNMTDELNYNSLIGWSIGGIVIVIIMIVSMIYFTEFSVFNAQKEVSESITTYADVTELKVDQEQLLNSFGMVDSENRIYRIPIDQAIEEILEQ
ncbi:MAG: hypothetical protein AAFW89_07780 [Bacteroidota bacterium]